MGKKNAFVFSIKEKIGSNKPTAYFPFTCLVMKLAFCSSSSTLLCFSEVESDEGDYLPNAQTVTSNISAPSLPGDVSLRGCQNGESFVQVVF